MSCNKYKKLNVVKPFYRYSNDTYPVDMRYENIITRSVLIFMLCVANNRVNCGGKTGKPGKQQI